MRLLRTEGYLADLRERAGKREFGDLAARCQELETLLVASPGSFERGRPDGSYGPGFRKFRLGRQNKGTRHGYRVVFLWVEIRGEHYCILAGVYLKTEYPEGKPVPETFKQRVRDEVAAQLQAFDQPAAPTEDDPPTP